MKILVIGASGRVGGKLVEKLLDAGHNVVGTTRKEASLFDHPRYTQIQLDLTSSREHLAQTIPAGVEAVYFVSGSRGKKLLEVDLHGAIKSMQAAEDRGIKRYIMLSTLFALDTSKWTNAGIESLKDYYIAKHYADSYLTNNTQLNYTILQPASLTEKSGSGKIAVDVDDNGENSIEDVAEVLVQLLENTDAKQRVITMHEGKMPIEAALATL